MSLRVTRRAAEGSSGNEMGRTRNWVRGEGSTTVFAEIAGVLKNLFHCIQG